MNFISKASHFAESFTEEIFMWKLNAEGKFISVSPSFSKYLTFNIADLSSKKMLEVFSFEDTSALEVLWHHLENGEAGTTDSVVVYDDVQHWFRLFFRPVEGSKTEEKTIEIFGINITELKHKESELMYYVDQLSAAEAELRQNLVELHNTVEIQQVELQEKQNYFENLAKYFCFLKCNINFDIEVAGDYFCKLFDIQSYEIEGKNFSEFLPNNQNLLDDIINEVFENESFTVNLELKINAITKNLRFTFFSLQAANYIPSSVHIYGQDITSIIQENNQNRTLLSGTKLV